MLNDIRQLLIHALGTCEDLRADIQALYSKNPNHYYALYRESKDINADMFDYFRTAMYVPLEQVAGIVEDAYSTKDFSKIEKLIKRGYPKVYKLVKHRSTIPHEAWAEAVTRQATNEETPEMEHYNSLICLVALVYIEVDKGRSIGIVGMDVITQSLALLQKNQYEARTYNHQLTRDVPDHDVATFETIKNRLNLPAKPLHIGNWVDGIIEQEIADVYLGGEQMTIEKAQTVDYLKLRNSIFHKGGKSSLIGFISGTAKRFGLYENMMDVELTEREVAILLNDMERMYEINKPPIPFDLVFINVLFLIAALKEFEKTRPYVKQASKEYFDFELVKSHKDTVLTKDMEITLLKAQVAELSTENAELKVKEKRSDKALATLQKTVKVAEDTVRKNNAIVAESKRLREFMYDAITKPVEEDSTTSESDETTAQVDKLTDVKMLVIGGHPRWCNLLKERLPHAVFRDVETAKHLSTEQVSDFDIIVFNTAYNSHSTYNRLLKVLDNKDKLCFVNGYNMPKTIQTALSHLGK